MKQGENPTVVFRYILVLAVCLAVLPSPLSGQEIKPDQVTGGLSFIDEVQVTVVNIDVFVRDRKGQSVTGLEKDDFRLIQDGHERELTHFAAYTEEFIDSLTADRAVEDASPVSIDAGDAVLPHDENAAQSIQPVHIVVYVDNENIRPHDRNRVLSETRRFIREIIHPHVQVMVVSALRSPKIVLPFTNDARAVEDALRSMNRDYGARVDKDRQRSRIIHDLQKQITDSKTGSNRQKQAAAADLQDRIRVYAEELAMELDFSIGTLREILTTLSGLPGRKVLLHVSNGLPAVPGRDLIDWYGDVYQKSSSLPMLARYNRRYVYNSLASSANAQGIRFYMIDATGLAGDASASAEHSQPIDPMFAGIHQINYQEPLLLLAEKTGGRALVGSNNITNLLEDMRGDLFTYYSLGYTLPSSGADTIHRIEVELPGYTEYELVYRQTLVEKSLETQVQDRVVSGLMLALDHNPMKIEATTGARTATSGGDRWLLPVEIKLPIESVAMLPEGDEFVGRVVLFVANRDLKGRQSDMQRREFEIRMPVADYESRSDESYAAEFDLLLNAGNHRIVIGVLDPVTRQTSFASIEQSVSTKR